MLNRTRRTASGSKMRSVCSGRNADMNDKDKAVFIRRYRARYQQHGYSPVSLGWGKGGRQHLRFSVLAGIGIGKEDSVLDIGCGFGDLFGYLKSTGWKGRYL